MSTMLSMSAIICGLTLGGNSIFMLASGDVDAKAVIGVLFGPMLLGFGIAIIVSCFRAEKLASTAQSSAKESRESFMNSLSEELSTLGLNTVEMNKEKQYVVTDNGMVTLVFDDTDPEDHILVLNGKPLHRSYHAEEWNVKSADGKNMSLVKEPTRI